MIMKLSLIFPEIEISEIGRGRCSPGNKVRIFYHDQKNRVNEYSRFLTFSDRLKTFPKPVFVFLLGPLANVLVQIHL